MANGSRKDRLSPPLMYAFRSAHAARDATEKLDLRDEAGERDYRRARVRERGRLSPSRAAARGGAGSRIADEYDRARIGRGPDRISNSVRKSILNFGLPDIAHRTIDEVGVDDIKERDRDGAEEFRTAARARYVSMLPAIPAVDADELKIRFVVQADLRCEPVNVPVEFVADVDSTATQFRSIGFRTWTGNFSISTIENCCCSTSRPGNSPKNIRASPNDSAA